MKLQDMFWLLKGGLYERNGPKYQIQIVIWLENLILFSPPDCVEKSDCPNEGLNYQCNTNVCECENGFVLNDEACVKGIK